MASNSTILSKQVADLRVELKAWEKEFALINGRKAGRDDISSDACMSVKYREFHRLRRPIDHPPGTTKVVTPRKPVRHVRQPGSQHKRGALRERAGNGNGTGNRHDNEDAVTPRKAWKGAGISLEVVLEEEQEMEPTPAVIRRALGPTPQKDGEVLGIFDFLAAAATPSKSGEGDVVGVEGRHSREAAATSINDTPNKPAIRSTPSKRTLSATPQSSSKRRFLDAFVGTPLKRRRLDDAPTPSSSRHHFATPSFLRRSFPLAPVDEDVTTGIAPIPKKRGLVRSLSSLIQGLRKQEDKRMDDEWDIMNEIEAAGENSEDEADDSDRPPSQQRQPSKVHVLVEDSQAATLSEPEMPLGPDQGAPGSDSEDDDGGRVILGADGRPRKPWKKKGLKRQTKRTNMRPVLHKARKASDLEEVEKEDGGEGSGTVDAHGCADADDDDAEEIDGDEGDGSKATCKAGRTDGASTAAVSPCTAKQGKPPKKVSASANANFRRLKIKQKNAKPSGRVGRKFGKR
ncbi:hypothetical protein LTR91_016702 [Friedmanniomyces endolithicus]|uniref:DNA replication regulator SLD2 n=1 Tax=Friedmanniomyces endolithicus TaxID=329885 RepID=A0AAN6QKL3_9PEZI|nr:hypothetical protein LTR94_007662 [Friedmanniomyces endolithicus]KAK0786368.1 hypothetical protein LTR75_013211 [Friedmanniomyces endolithicus]KAK0800110.1 hypothetical protein LTR38_007252 [Friedmanniomyces endolithicus]KAK0810049.1 hypothetical protein LTR59_002451 [Friedmanniomyces endolithicus]KAK0843225.1 hypothetical protein LTS02_016176 [Friedmanniomyces endolithicus]